ncbi:MAG: BON domain-containing protein [Deltaproteobacteria bacterium]|nr:BON domain-containing protein [Deltaproteobacteria bacterium]
MRLAGATTWGGRMIGCWLLATLAALPVAGEEADALGARVRQTLAADAELAARGAQLAVEERGGVVRLSGTVRLYADKLRAERIVRATAAERRIDNQVHVAPLMPASDREIKRAIVSIGKWSRFQGAGMQITVRGGAVRVRGTFHDPSDVLVLTEQIAAIEGVRAIEIDALYPV